MAHGRRGRPRTWAVCLCAAKTVLIGSSTTSALDTEPDRGSADRAGDAATARADSLEAALSPCTSAHHVVQHHRAQQRREDSRCRWPLPAASKSERIRLRVTTYQSDCLRGSSPGRPACARAVPQHGPRRMIPRPADSIPRCSSRSSSPFKLGARRKSSRPAARARGCRGRP